MKKKIDYCGIPKEVLNMVVGECYGLGEYTLKDELDKYGEDILAARYAVKEYEHTLTPYIEYFHCWTKTWAMVLIDSVFGDKVVLGLNREIPKELGEGLSERRVEKRKRTKRGTSKVNKSKHS